MAQTFGDCWTRVRLHAPAVPTFLAREFVNVAWKQIAATRRWGFLRGTTVLTILASRNITSCVVTQGSATVTSAGLFLAADQGRQFQIATFPTYTIQTFTDVNTIVLDRPYGEDTLPTAAGLVFDAYATMPLDFASFRIIPDFYNQRRLAFWITEDQLNILDPTRQCSDTGPRCLIAADPSTYLPTLGQIRYEYWPRPMGPRSYTALYNTQASVLDDTTVLNGVMADGAEVIVKGALRQAALWPGTGDKPNPYFNLALAKQLQAEFELETQRLSLRDDEQYPDDLATVHWERWPLADLAYNDLALRATDATVADLF